MSKAPRKAAKPKPTPKKAAPAKAASQASPPKVPRTPIAARFPPVVLEGLDRRASRDGLSRNDALIRAVLDYGDFPDGRPDIKPERRTAGSLVKTSTPDPVKPGARLDKASIGKRTGAKIDKSALAKTAAPAMADEEAI